MAAVDNQMWPASGSFVQGTRQGAAQFLCIEIIHRRASAAVAVRYGSRGEEPAVRGRENDRHISGDILRVIIGAEVRLSGDVRLRVHTGRDDRKQEKE